MKLTALTVGDAFAGIGGFSLGFQQAGYRVAWQIEIDPFARHVLARHWPEVRKPHDIRDALRAELQPVDVVCGGDPCPIRSRARGKRAAVHPDLSGYFLALVGRCRPRWVVRENVPAPDVADFAAALEALGYGTRIVEINARPFTAQNRLRQFVVGCPRGRAARLEKALPDASDGAVDAAAQGPEAPVALCVTAHPRRLTEDNLVLEGDRGLRSLSAEEREALQGFPRGWTAGLSWSRRCILLGNAVAVPVVRWIAERIVEVDA